MNRQKLSLHHGTIHRDGRATGSSGFMPNRRPGAARGNMPRHSSSGARANRGEESYAADISYDDAEINEEMLQFLANRRG